MTGKRTGEDRRRTIEGDSEAFDGSDEQTMKKTEKEETNHELETNVTAQTIGENGQSRVLDGERVHR